LPKKSIATASQAEGEQKKLRHHGEKGRWLRYLNHNRARFVSSHTLKSDVKVAVFVAAVVAA
jgi:hypothetical protein